MRDQTVHTGNFNRETTAKFVLSVSQWDTHTHLSFGRVNLTDFHKASNWIRQGANENNWKWTKQKHKQKIQKKTRESYLGVRNYGIRMHTEIVIFMYENDEHFYKELNKYWWKYKWKQ